MWLMFRQTSSARSHLINVMCFVYILQGRREGEGDKRGNSQGFELQGTIKLGLQEPQRHVVRPEVNTMKLKKTGSLIITIMKSSWQN